MSGCLLPMLPSFISSFNEVLNSVDLRKTMSLTLNLMISITPVSSLQQFWPICFWIWRLISQGEGQIKYGAWKCIMPFVSLHAYFSSIHHTKFFILSSYRQASLFSWKWKQNRMGVLMGGELLYTLTTEVCIEYLTMYKIFCRCFLSQCHKITPMIQIRTMYCDR